MGKRKWSLLFAAATAAVVLAACAPAGVPAPALTSPVQGASEPGPFLLGSAAEKALVGPCVSAPTTITATTSSPNSDVAVNFGTLVDGQYEDFEYTVVPAGTGSSAVTVPAGCYRVWMQSVSKYCDGSVGMPFACQVVLPPTYRFTYTVTF